MRPHVATAPGGSAPTPRAVGGASCRPGASTGHPNGAAGPPSPPGSTGPRQHPRSQQQATRPLPNGQRTWRGGPNGRGVVRMARPRGSSAPGCHVIATGRPIAARARSPHHADTRDRAGFYFRAFVMFRTPRRPRPFARARTVPARLGRPSFQTAPRRAKPSGPSPGGAARRAALSAAPHRRQPHLRREVPAGQCAATSGGGGRGPGTPRAATSVQKDAVAPEHAGRGLHVAERSAQVPARRRGARGRSGLAPGGRSGCWAVARRLPPRGADVGDGRGGTPPERMPRSIPPERIEADAAPVSGHNPIQSTIHPPIVTAGRPRARASMAHGPAARGGACPESRPSRLHPIPAGVRVCLLRLEGRAGLRAGPVCMLDSCGVRGRARCGVHACRSALSCRVSSSGAWPASSCEGHVARGDYGHQAEGSEA
jgi:hypothetical protein